MTKKSLIIISIVLAGLLLLYKLADTFSPGTYGHAEQYELNYPEDKVIEAINKLKNSNPNLIVPKVTIQNSEQLDLNDGKEKETDQWHKFYFYDKDKNQILFTWTRPSGLNTTTFAFVSINNGLNIGSWQDINDDFGFLENRKIKENFEDTILEKVKKNLDNNEGQ